MVIEIAAFIFNANIAIKCGNSVHLVSIQLAVEVRSLSVKSYLYRKAQNNGLCYAIVVVLVIIALF